MPRKVAASVLRFDINNYKAAVKVSDEEIKKDYDDKSYLYKKDQVKIIEFSLAADAKATAEEKAAINTKLDEIIKSFEGKTPEQIAALKAEELKGAAIVKHDRWLDRNESLFTSNPAVAEEAFSLEAG